VAKNRLKDLTVTRVDLVDKGSSDEAVVALYKSLEPADPAKVLNKWQADELRHRAARKAKAVCKSVAQEVYPELPWREAVEKFDATPEGKELREAVEADAYETAYEAAAIVMAPPPVEKTLTQRVADVRRRSEAALAGAQQFLKERTEPQREHEEVMAQARELLAWARNDPLTLNTRWQDAELRLNDMAKARSVRTGETFAKAYTAVLQSDEGRPLYAAATQSRERLIAVGAVAPEGARRYDVRMKKSADVLAVIKSEAKAMFPDETDVRVAEAKFSETERGHELYAEYTRAAKALDLAPGASDADFEALEKRFMQEREVTKRPDESTPTPAPTPTSKAAGGPSNPTDEWLATDEGKRWYAENRASLVKPVGS